MSHGLAKVRLALLCIPLIAAALLASATTAHADANIEYFGGEVVHGVTVNSYSTILLNDSYAEGDSVCAGAADAGMNFYGHYYCAADYACHDYGGTNLYAYAHNHETIGPETLAGKYWSSPDRSSSCSHGSTTAARSSARASQLGSVPPATVTTDVDGRTCLTVTDTDGQGSTCRSAADVAKGELVATLESGDGVSPKTRVLYAYAPANTALADVTGTNVSTDVAAEPSDRLVALALPSNATQLNWTVGSRSISISLDTLKPISS